MEPSLFDPDTTPALQPPVGVVPNFVNPESRAAVPRVIIYIFLPLMFVFLVLRMYTRMRISGGVGADDYLIILAAASTTAYCAIALSIFGHPLGLHLWDVPISAITESYIEISFANTCLYALSALFVKTSLLALYMRIFQPVDYKRYMMWAGIIVIVPFYISNIVANTIECVPHAGEGWTSLSSKERCAQPVVDVSAVQGVFSAVTDFYVLFIPVHLVLGMRLGLQQKIAVSAVFLTGLCGCICSVTYCVYRFIMRTSRDFTWTALPMYALGPAELSVGIICSCMPVVFVLFKKMTHDIARSFPMSYLLPRPPTDKEAGRPSRPTTPDAVKELPTIPKATLSGLRSLFARKSRASQAPESLVNPETAAAADDDLDYHTQIRRNFA